ncbi:MAG TPA: FtsW/RodA/SpoVE family cell cycle protein, partial [Thermoleophilaceae bacterium]|nr:FtsW/RodA/SpoVE family cell cycle protein [Thermoleophilaceae bacterium]
MSARTREMLGLIPVALIVSAGFGAVILARSEGGPPGAALDEVKAGTLTYGLVFLGLCLFAHLFMRARLPDADPYLFPLGATLAAFGLVVIYRIDPELAREQAQWFVIGLVVFVATIVFLRDHAVLERYRYTIAAAGIALLLMPRVPGLGEQVNGAFLNVKLGPISFQPAEFAKIAIIIFLASYLGDTREVLVRGRIPRLSLKHFGPLLLV